MEQAAALRPPAQHAAFLGPPRDGPHARKRAANDHMRRGLHAIDQHDLIPFFCECNSPECFAAIWRTTVAFDQIRAGGSSQLVTSGHNAVAAA